MVATWPAGLPYQPYADSLVHRLPEDRAVAETEAGPSRVRRLYSVTTQWVEMNLALSRPQYEAWRAWHRWETQQGAAWFDMPIYTGASFQTCSVRWLKSPPDPRPSGNGWLLPMRLETQDMPIVEIEDLDPVWPESLPYEPVPDSLEPEDHGEILRGEGEGGPIAVRRRFVNTPGRQGQAWDLKPALYEVFRAWYRRALENGARWFEMPIWTGDRYRTCRVRWAEPPQARLRVGKIWRVTGRLDVKLAATLTPGEMWGALAAPQLHYLVHTVLPAALPAGS